jgi:hypothetical protein
MLSLMVHLAGGSLYGLLAQYVVKAMPQLASKQSQQLPRSDIIRLEKAEPEPHPVVVVQPPPRPKLQPPPPPPPQPLVAPRPMIAPRESHPELAHITHHAPRQTAPSQGRSVAQNEEQPPAAPQQQPNRQQYSDEQLAQLNGAFQQTIQASHQTLAQANAAMETAPVITTKHFQMTFNGIHEGMSPGDGIISLVAPGERHGNQVYYWTHYEYMYPDGHVEEDDIPWQFHYPINDDPFARHDRRVPLQAPPQGFVPNRPLKPILEQFFGGPQVN